MCRNGGRKKRDDIESPTGGVEHYSWVIRMRDKDTWWWNDEVHEMMTVKTEARKMWETPGRQEDR